MSINFRLFRSSWLVSISLFTLLAAAPSPGQDELTQALPVDDPLPPSEWREEGAPGNQPVWKEDPRRILEGLEGRTPPDQYMDSLRDLGILRELAGRSALTSDKSTTNWSRVGPVGGFSGSAQNGRIAGLQIVPGTTGYYLFAGSCQGGLWRAHSASLFQWTDIGYNLPHPSVRALAVDPDNLSHIFVGTGDHMRATGAGMFETTDNGATWNQVNLPWGNTPQYFYRLEYLADDPITGLARYAGVCSFGPIFSDDGGVTWQKGTSATGGLLPFFWTDLVRHPTDPWVLFAAGCELTSGNSSGIFKSTDYGRTWTRLTLTGLAPSHTWDRATLAICRDTPATLAVLISTGSSLQGVYKTSDSGATWANITNELIDTGAGYSFGSNQVFHAQAINIHPTNPDKIYAAAVGLAVSSDGGASWDIGFDEHGIETGHADITQLLFSGQTGSSIMWICNDGGIYYHSFGSGTTTSGNGNTSTGLACSEIDFLDAKGSIIGIGLQDNGSLLSTNAGSSWTYLSGGDGGDIEIFDAFSGDIFLNSGVFSGDDPWRTFRRYLGGSNEFTDNPPKYMPRMFFSHYQEKMWTTDASALFSMDVDGPLTWVEEYSDWATTDHGVRTFWGSYARESSFWVAYWENNSTNQNSEDLTYVYLGSGGWTQKHHTDFNPTGDYVLTVTPSRQWPDEAWVGIRSGSGSPKIFHVLNGGDTAIDITGNLTSVGEVRTIEVMPFNPQVIWAGTDLGVFQTTDGGVSWAPFMEGLPIGRSAELKFVEDATHTGTHKLLLAMDGRGVWSRDVTMPPIVFVDRRVAASGSGSRWDPIKTISAAVAVAPSGSIIAIHSDDYNEPQTLSKNVQLVTWGGDSVIH